MGQELRRRPITSPAFNYTQSFKSTAAIIKNRVLKLTSGGGVIHSTGSSGRVVFGLALSSATAAGKTVAVLLFGVSQVEASTRAIKVGDVLRATSGAASTASRLGGTVRTSTVSNNIVGMALTSAAAGAGKRLINVFFGPEWHAVLLK